MRKLIAGMCLGLSIATGAIADPIAKWHETTEEDIAWLGPNDWTSFATNYQMDIGLVTEAKYSIAWRDGREIGVWMMYTYAQPVSPPSLPGRGPMKYEIVEVTIACDAGTARIHQMHLYDPEFQRIGIWFDPEAEANPTGFGSSSLVGKVAQGVC